ncbi:ABC transporter permease [Streptacidiphilus cavernicola]|uniref:ABC transporter permease n=1 Tax=Streptacidiphilus cavernicola TaxID=3342716 RepID=A0ABV6VP59_9ACTN
MTGDDLPDHPARPRARPGPGGPRGGPAAPPRRAAAPAGPRRAADPGRAGRAVARPLRPDHRHTADPAARPRQPRPPARHRRPGPGRAQQADLGRPPLADRRLRPGRDRRAGRQRAGVTAGLGGRATEQALLRSLDVLYAFPGILLAMAIATLLDTGLGAVVLSLSVVLTPAVTRVVFTEVRRIRSAEFLEAARVSGAGRTAVALRQVAPVVAPVVLVYCSSLVGLSIVYAAGLSFLGLGVAPPAAEWGAMLDELRPSLLTHPQVAVMPALVILAVSVVFNTLGEALRRRLGDAGDLRAGALR